MAKYFILDEEENQPVMQQEQSQQSSERPFDFSSLQKGVGNFAKQGLTGLSEGVLTTYGDILELLGLQSPDLTSQEEERYAKEHAATPYELALMGGEETELPYGLRLPSSKGAQQVTEKLGIEEPEGFSQDVARRTGRFTGAAAAFGGKGGKGALAAGVTGAGLKEMGAPPWVQALGEIAAAVRAGGAGTRVTSSSPQVSSKIKELRKMGFSETDITLAKNALEDRGWLKKSAKMSAESARKFKETAKSFEAQVKGAMERSFPGLEEGGVSGLKENASKLFGALKEEARHVDITKHEPLTKAIGKAISRAESKISNLPEEKEAIAFLKEGYDALTQKGAKVTAEDYIDWYQKIGKIGKWVDPHTKEAILGELKDGLKESLRSQGLEGRYLADSLEHANSTWMKYLNAEDVVDLVGKATTDEGMNYAKLSKALQNADNMKMMIKGLGEKEAANVRKIAEVGSSIQDFEKILQSNLSKDVLGTGAKLYATAQLAFGNPKPFAGLVTAEAASRFGSKFLTDPKWQNLQLKLFNAVKNNAGTEIRSITDELVKLMDGEAKKEAPPSQPSKPRYQILE